MYSGRGLWCPFCRWRHGEQWSGVITWGHSAQSVQVWARSTVFWASPGLLLPSHASRHTKYKIINVNKKSDFTKSRKRFLLFYFPAEGRVLAYFLFSPLWYIQSKLDYSIRFSPVLKDIPWALSCFYDLTKGKKILVQYPFFSLSKAKVILNLNCFFRKTWHRAEWYCECVKAFLHSPECTLFDKEISVLMHS